MYRARKIEAERAENGLTETPARRNRCVGFLDERWQVVARGGSCRFPRKKSQTGFREEEASSTL